VSLNRWAAIVGFVVVLGIVGLTAWRLWRPTASPTVLPEQSSGDRGAPPFSSPLQTHAPPWADLGVKTRPVHDELDAPPAGLQHLLDGLEPGETEPIPFTNEAIPARYVPSGFAAIMSDVLESCSTPISLLDVDCTEAPCLALLQNRVSQFRPNACPAWLATYGDSSMANISLRIECPDGLVFITIVTPYEGVDLTVPEPFLDSLQRRRLERAMQWSMRELCVGE
jgi:hypothetical protein